MTGAIKWQCMPWKGPYMPWQGPYMPWQGPWVLDCKPWKGQWHPTHFFELDSNSNCWREKNNTKTLLKIMAHHMASYDIIWWEGPSYDGQNPSYDGKNPSYDGRGHHMMSYDAIWWLLCFLAPACPRWKSHIFKKTEKLAMTKAMEHSFRLKDFCDKKTGRALQRAAVHHGKGSESHEKP